MNLLCTCGMPQEYASGIGYYCVLGFLCPDIITEWVATKE